MLRRIHWAGGVSLQGGVCLPGWPACCSGDRAYRIKAAGNWVTAPALAKVVSCKRCLALMAKGTTP